MKLAILMGFLSTSIASGQDSALNSCFGNNPDPKGAIASCQIIRTRTEERIKTLVAAVATTLGPIERSPDGKILYLSHRDAETHCLGRNGRLPTAKELAFASQNWGARGIIETAFPESTVSSSKVQSEISSRKSERYYPIFSRNSAGLTVVDFYFNHDGYKAPEDDFSKNQFWSSSIDPRDSDNAYIFNGAQGFVSVNEFSFRTNQYIVAFRCQMQP